MVRFGSLNRKWAALQFSSCFLQDYITLQKISRTESPVKTPEDIISRTESESVDLLTDRIIHVQDKIADILHVSLELVERRAGRRYHYDPTRSLPSCYYH